MQSRRTCGGSTQKSAAVLAGQTDGATAGEAGFGTGRFLFPIKTLKTLQQPLALHAGAPILAASFALPCT
jgi:hypothetical protein